MMSTYMLLGNITEPVELKKVLAGGKLGEEWFTLEKKEIDSYLISINGKKHPLNKEKYNEICAFLLSSQSNVDLAIEKYSDFEWISYYLAIIIFFELIYNHSNKIQIKANFSRGWRGEHFNSLLDTDESDLFFDNYSKSVLFCRESSNSPEFEFIIHTIIMSIVGNFASDLLKKYVLIVIKNIIKSLQRLHREKIKPLLDKKKKIDDVSHIWTPVTLIYEERGNKYEIFIETTDDEIENAFDNLTTILKTVKENNIKYSSVTKNIDGKWEVHAKIDNNQDNETEK